LKSFERVNNSKGEEMELQAEQERDSRACGLRKRRQLLKGIEKGPEEHGA
jgi:hypothetical protein